MTMIILKEVLQKGLMKGYPMIKPEISFDQEEQSRILKGEWLIVTDNKYKARWIARLSEKSLKSNKSYLHVEDIILQAMDKISENAVRKEEINQFYLELKMNS